MRLASALAILVVVATACGSTASAPTATPRRTVPPVQTTQSPVCPGAPNQPSGKATITLENGATIVIQLHPDAALKTVSIFALKSNSGFYNGTIFHRVEDWVVQGGDPLGTGFGGGQECTELSDRPFVRGEVGMARGGNIAISNDSQFFILKKDAHNLDKAYTNFGTVISGMDVVDKIAIGDKIKTIKVE